MHNIGEKAKMNHNEETIVCPEAEGPLWKYETPRLQELQVTSGIVQGTTNIEEHEEEEEGGDW